MKTIWIIAGRVAYWLGLPVIILFVRGSQRTRIIIKHGERTALIQNWLSDGSWVLPGGGIKKTETPLQGAVRELKEETGLRLQASDLCAVAVQPYTKHAFNCTYHIFSVTLDSSQTLVGRRPEVVEVRWFTANEMLNAKLGDEVLPALAAWSGWSGTA